MAEKIIVKAPNGTEIEFPATMSRAEIAQVMRREFPPQTQQPTSEQVPQTDQPTGEQVPPDDMTRGSARFMGMNIEGGPPRSAEQRELIRRGFEERGGPSLGVYGRLRAGQEAISEAQAQLPPEERPMDPRHALFVRAFNSALLGLPSQQEDYRELVAQAGEDSPMAAVVGDVSGFFIPGSGVAKVGKMGAARLGLETGGRATQAGLGASAALAEGALYESTVGESVRAAEQGVRATISSGIDAAKDFLTDPINLAVSIGLGGALGAATTPVVRRRTTAAAQDAPQRPQEPSQPDEALTPEAVLSQQEQATQQAVDIGLDFRAAIAGDQDAMKRLAGHVNANPEIIDAATKLEIDMPIEALTDNDELLYALSNIRDASVGAKTLFANKLTEFAQRADDLMLEMRNINRIDQLDADVPKAIDDTLEQLKNAEDAAYQQAERFVPGRTLTRANNVIELLRNRVADEGSPSGLSNFEKVLYRKYIGSIDGTSTEVPPYTIQSLRSIKQDIRNPTQADSPYLGIDESLRNRYLGALSADELAAYADNGGDAAVAAITVARNMHKKFLGVKKQKTALFGRLGQNSLAAEMRRAMTGAQKGNVKPLSKVLDNLPAEFRRDAVNVAIREMAGPNEKFSLSKFVEIIDAFNEYDRVGSLVYSTLGPRQTRIVRTLGKLGKRIQQVERVKERTGIGTIPALQVIREGQETLISQIITAPNLRAITRGGIVAGVTNNPLLGAFASLMKGADKTPQTGKQWEEAAGDLLGSKEFQDVLTDMYKPISEQQLSINRLLNDRAFKRWARVAGVESPESWITGIMTTIRANVAAAEEQEGLPGTGSTNPTTRGLTVSLPTQGGSGMRDGQPIQGQ